MTEFTEVKGARKYRRRTVDEKRQIVEETLSSGRSVAEIARSHEVNANQLFDWRKQYLDGRLGVNGRERALLPVTVNEARDCGAAEPAASTPSAQAPGTIRIQLPRGEVHVEESVDPDTLRVGDPVPGPMIGPLANTRIWVAAGFTDTLQSDGGIA